MGGTEGDDGLGGEAPRRPAFDRLVEELVALFGQGVDASLSEEEFDRWARRIFRHQYATNPTYRSFCRGRGVSPADLDSWRRIPCVPTRAFKRLRLVSDPGGGDPDAIFRTSGTSRGPEERGVHCVPRIELYRASLLPNFRAHLLPDGASLPFLSLIPDPDRTADSSLSRMVGIAAEAFAEEVEWLVDPEEGLRLDALRTALSRAISPGRPVLVLTTAFALVHLLEAAEREGWSVELPEGSRMMETGGFKGRSRRVGRDVLYRAVEDRLGIPRTRIVNEYGMTELLSQFYEPVLRGGERRLVAPPWVRTRILEPSTLSPAPSGTPGLLAHLDLANAGSVSAILTEDMGRAVDGGFRLEGRSPDAEPRGCSRAMDELLSASRG